MIKVYEITENGLEDGGLLDGRTATIIEIPEEKWGMLLDPETWEQVIWDEISDADGKLLPEYSEGELLEIRPEVNWNVNPPEIVR